MTVIKVERPPKTAMEAFNMLPEGTLSEVIENQHIWIVDPETKEATGFELTQGKYSEFSKAQS